MVVCSPHSHKTLGSQNHDDALEMQVGTLEDQMYILCAEPGASEILLYLVETR